jgi:UDP-N-acetylmuramoylalanine--D-glutamate ligase
VVRLLVYGLGRSGGAVVARARREGHAVAFIERRAHGDDITSALTLGATRVSDVTASPADLCVAAPGVPLAHPDLERLRALGVEVIGEVEWIWRTVPARFVGVTGTAGKGTVTRWLTDLSVAAGIDAVAGGNIDPALAAVARPDATLVVELSSFQLERCPTLRPDVAVALNLGVDHLDRHGDVAGYHAAKRRLIANLTPSETFVYNHDDPLLRAWARETPAETRAYSTLQPAAHEAERVAAWCDPERGALTLDGEVLLPVGELKVSGRHQLGNALAVALAARALGAGTEAIRRGLRAFRGLPGRYALVGTLAGVRFVEDSIATRELAVAAALETTPGPVVWLAGGVDKGADPGVLETLVKDKVSLCLGLGASGPALVATAGRWTRAELVAERDGRAMLRQAVRRAFEHLQAVHGGRGSVLLAPLAASFDQFRDYADRADAFREAVRTLAEELRADAALRGEEVAWTPSS